MLKWNHGRVTYHTFERIRCIYSLMKIIRNMIHVCRIQFLIFHFGTEISCSLFAFTYMYIYIYIHICAYIYTYLEKDREIGTSSRLESFPYLHYCTFMVTTMVFQRNWRLHQRASYLQPPSLNFRVYNWQGRDFHNSI